MADSEPKESSEVDKNTNDRKYWCFISYVHGDDKHEGREWATWLRQSIEEYEIPDELSEDLQREIPKRIYPVFRDKDELRTGPIWENIYDALDNSRTLVVICSPRVRQSEYVAEEIRYFRNRNKNPHQIHCAVIEGDPRMPKTCLPDSLLYELDETGEIDKSRPRDNDLLAVFTPPKTHPRLKAHQEGWTSPEAFRLHLEAAEFAPKEIDGLVTEYDQGHHRRVRNELCHQIQCGVTAQPASNRCFRARRPIQ